MKCLQVQRDGAASAQRGRDFQGLGDLLRQQFCQSNANSKGQRLYLTQGLPEQRPHIREKGSSSPLWCQWGYRVRT